MGNEEVDAPTKTPKSSSAQEQPPSSPAAVYPDWASFQAYYNTTGTPAIPPPGFFHSPVPSSQPHPYIWGQHMMPPYGTPPPYVAMYPHGGLYGHPSMPPGPHAYAPYAMPSQNGAAEASVVAAAGSELEGKSVEGKKKNSLKKSKGSLGSLSMLTGKGNEKGKTSGASANSLVSQSDESGNEGSSEGSDSSSQNGSQQKPHCEQSTLSAEEAKNGYAAGNTARVPRTPAMVGPNMAMVAMPPNGVAGPTTNLNIGMDYWGGPAQAVPAIRSKLPIAASTPSVVSDNHMGSRDPSELWLQDEREMKRQRRKQSNRESARRSRLRKQAECEELAQRVDTLKQENGTLREELERMREECQKLAAENASLSERLENHREGSRAGADPIKASAVDTTDRGS